VSPQGSDFILTSDVPDGEADILVFDSLDIESCGVLAETRNKIKIIKAIGRMGGVDR
jgi:hypothetical protein